MGETNITQDILKLFVPPMKAVKIHVDQYQEAGTPDVFACVDGKLWALEVKRPGKEPTPIQRLRLSQWRRAGAIALVVDDPDQVEEILRERRNMSERLMLPVVAESCGYGPQGQGPRTHHVACACVLQSLEELKTRLAVAEELLMKLSVNWHFQPVHKITSLQRDVEAFLRKDEAWKSL